MSYRYLGFLLHQLSMITNTLQFEDVIFYSKVLVGLLVTHK